jgi:hypothetical protein
MITQNPYRSHGLLGVDLGKVKDYTVISGIERQTYPDKVMYAVGEVVQMKLQTPYPVIKDAIVKAYHVLRTRYGNCKIIIDTTGVGMPVVDTLRNDNYIKRDLEPINITGGNNISLGQGYLNVPKSHVVDAALLAFHNKRIMLHPGIPLNEKIKEEFLGFHMKIKSDSGHTSYESGKDSEHDDIVLSICLAIWWGEYNKAKISHYRHESNTERW